MPETADLEVELKTESQKAVIAGKTAVPFRTFVGLILQRKVFQLFKQWDKEPVILSSELLTQLASAPSDSPENRAHLVIVTLGVGTLFGIFVAAVAVVLLSLTDIFVGPREFAIVALSLVAVALVGMVLARVQKLARAQKIADAMERTAQFLSKR